MKNIRTERLTTDPTSMRYCICHDMVENGLDMSEMSYKSKWYKGFRLIHTFGAYSLAFEKDPRNMVDIIYCPWCGRKLTHSYFAETRKYEDFKSLEY